MTTNEYVYRFFDKAGELLYVGITSNLGRRINQHQAKQPWWPDVARVDIETVSDREGAAFLERMQIEMQRPIYNRTHNHDPQMPGEPRDRQSHKPPYWRGDLVRITLDRGTVEVGLIQRVTESGNIILSQKDVPLDQLLFDEHENFIRIDTVRQLDHIDCDGNVTWTPFGPLEDPVDT